MKKREIQMRKRELNRKELIDRMIEKRDKKRRVRTTIYLLNVAIICLAICVIFFAILNMNSTVYNIDIFYNNDDEFQKFKIEDIINTSDTSVTMSKSDDKQRNEFTSLRDYSYYDPNPEVIIINEKKDPVTVINENIGSDVIETDFGTLVRYDLPDVYYPGLDYSSFQPFMGYKHIKDKTSQAYHVVYSDKCYSDENGFRRYGTDSETQLTINSQDDYVIALGTFYKEKGTAGSRYLIVTSTGMYTAITGDEKADEDTDKYHMFSPHKNGTCAGIIEWIVDESNLNHDIKKHGTITKGPVEVLRGDILYIYKIN